MSMTGLQTNFVNNNRTKKRVVVEVGSFKDIPLKEKHFIHYRSGNPIEEALMIKTMIDSGKTQSQVSEETKLSQPQISKRLNLLKNLHPELIERLLNNEIRPSIGYALSKLTLEEQVKYLSQKRITLKEVEEKRRNMLITDEIMGLLMEEVSLGENTETPTEFERGFHKGIKECIRILKTENANPNLINSLEKLLCKKGT